MEEQNKMEELISDAVEEDSRRKPRKGCRKRVYLFNCDNTYSLDSVEKLLLDMKGDIRRELSFDIVKTYFRLSQMSDMCEKTIPKLHMDVAIFVVHANESRLSINEENAGIGYAKIYRALLQATDGRVIIVIGGDDYYKNKDEEESSVISRWASRKISSQFKEEFLDGRKSFVFSWNEMYRVIHEEALIHYFDSRRRGQKFKCKSNDRSRSTQERLRQRTPESKKTAATEQQQLKDHMVGSAHSSLEIASNRRTPMLGNMDKSKEGKGKEESKTLKKGTEYKELKDNVEGSLESCASKNVERNIPEAQEATTSIFYDCVIINMDDVIGVSDAQQINNKTEVGTLVLKTRMRNGCISYKDDEMVTWDQQWMPPGELLPLISEQLANVAEAEVEIYHVKETGAARVIIKDLSNTSVIYAIIEYFYNLVTGALDSVFSFFKQ